MPLESSENTAFAVITVSDRAFSGERQDKSGPEAVSVLETAGFACCHTEIVPDGTETIRNAIVRTLNTGTKNILLTGGTGIAPRDFTAEAITSWYETADVRFVELPGIGERLRALGVASGAPGALLSRGFGGILHAQDSRVFLIAAPGSPGGARDGARMLADLAAHVHAQLAGDSTQGHF